MGIIVRNTRAGRKIIELDGHSDYYGAYVQGALVCRISVPQDYHYHWVVANLPNCPNAGPQYIDAIREAVPGIRVYEWRQIQ